MSKFYRCPFLSQGLFVGYDHLRHCHLSVHAPDAREQNFIGKYNGPEQQLDWKYIFDLKKDLTTKMRNGDFPVYCEGCSWIEEFEDPDQYKSDYEEIITTLWLCHFNTCNCVCIYCYLGEDIKNNNIHKGFNAIPLVKDMLNRKIYDLENGQVSFGVGEPTMLYNFEELIDLLRTSGGKRFAVYTNAINHSNVLSKLLESDPELNIYIVTSIDAATRETFKKIKSVDRFDDVCKTLKKYADSARKVSPERLQVKFIIIPGINDTVKEIDAWFDMCVNKLGIRSLAFDIEEQWFIKNRDNIPKHIYDLCKRVKEKAEKQNIPLKFFDRAVLLNL